MPDMGEWALRSFTLFSTASSAYALVHWLVKYVIVDWDDKDKQTYFLFAIWCFAASTGLVIMPIMMTRRRYKSSYQAFFFLHKSLLLTVGAFVTVWQAADNQVYSDRGLAWVPIVDNLMHMATVFFESWWTVYVLRSLKPVISQI